MAILNIAAAQGGGEGWRTVAGCAAGVGGGDAQAATINRENGKPTAAPRGSATWVAVSSNGAAKEPKGAAVNDAGVSSAATGRVKKPELPGRFKQPKWDDEKKAVVWGYW